MRTVLRLFLGVGLLAVASVPAAWQDPKDVIERAIRAHAGSEAQLAKRKVSVSKSRGVIVLPGAGDTPSTRECMAVLPDRIKWSGEFTPPGNKIPFVITLDGLKGWRIVFGGAQDMTPPEYDAVQDEAQFLWLCTLIPLKERSYTLSPLPQVQVNGRPAVGVKVESRGRGTVQLYFDARDNLLVKGTYRSREGGIEVPKECVFSDYKDFAGLKQPMRQTTFDAKGKKTEDWTYESYSFPATIDVKVFVKP